MKAMTSKGIPVVGGTVDSGVIAKLDTQPLNSVKWIHHSKIISNDYNMNRVAATEMKLLATSILQDGFTMPVVCIYDQDQDVYVLIDGFHRTFTVKNNPDVQEMTGGYVPVVTLNKSMADRVQATIRHNRARGKHSTEGMSNAVFKLLEEGKTDVEVISELGMEAEELVRLKHITGFSKLFKNTAYKKSWVDSQQIKIKKEYDNEVHSNDTLPRPQA